MGLSRQKLIDPGKVAVYIRWSTEDQGEGTTLDVQMEGCRHYILSQGWEWTESLVYIDDGYSGGSLDRPGMEALRAAVREGSVDCVVVFKLDRLSRSVVDTVRLVMEEWDGLCHVKSARESIDTVSQAGRMFFYMLVSYAEWERALIKERTLSGKVRRAQEGRNPGFRPPYGYGPRFEPVPAEARIVRRIYSCYRQGAGIIAITRQLNGEGLRFRDGKRWHPSTVRKILANPIYCGDLHYGRRARNPNRGKRTGEPFYLPAGPAVVCRDAVQALVTREDWEEVQSVRRSRPGIQAGTSGRAFSSQHLLTGVARCACGEAVIGYAPSKGEALYYRCAGQRQSGACACGYIPQQAVDRAVLRKLEQEFGARLLREHRLRRAGAEAAQQAEGARAQLLAAEQALQRLDAAGARMRRLFREGDLTLQEFRAQSQDIQRERADLQERCQRLRGAGAGAGSGADASAVLGPAPGAGPAAAPPQVSDLPAEQRKQVLRHMVESVTLFRAKGASSVRCDVRWKWVAQRPDEEAEATAT